MLATLAIINLVFAGYMINETNDLTQIAAQDPTVIVAIVDTVSVDTLREAE